MPDRDREPDKRKPAREGGLTEEELEAERGGALPDREALSVLSADVAIPADPSIAADVLSGEDPPDDVPPPEEAPPEEAPPEEAPPPET